MPANTTPIFGLTPNIGTAVIPTTAALARSDGLGLIGSNLMFVLSAGAFGTFLQKVRFFSVGATPTTGNATVLRAYIGTTYTPGVSTTQFNTTLIGELSVPAVPSANATNSSNFYDIPLNFAIPSGYEVFVSQHAVQATNQYWQATVFASDY